MAINIGSSFLYKGEYFLDERQGTADTLEDLKNWNIPIPEGFEIYLKSEKIWYTYDSTYHSSITGQFKPRNLIEIKEIERLDQKIDEIEEDIQELDVEINGLDFEVTNKFNILTEKVNGTIVNVTLEDSTGIFTFTKSDGTVFTINSTIEKSVMNFYYDSTTTSIVLVLEDGTVQSVSLAAFIDDYAGVDSSTISVSVNSEKIISANIKNNSIAKIHLTTALNEEISEASSDILTLQSYFFNGKAKNSLNSEKLGGQLPSYYASQIDLSSKLSLTGGVMTGDIILGDFETAIYQKNEYDEEWSREILGVKKNDGNFLWNLGTRAKGDELKYIYLGAIDKEGFENEEAFKIYPDGNVSVQNKIISGSKIDKWDLISSLFELVDGKIHIVGDKDFYTGGAISSRGLDSGSSVGIDWEALAGNTNEQINISHLTTALENYVLTTDPRLTDPREASDVYDWAKSENKPTYSWTEIINKPVDFNPILNNIDWNLLNKTGFNWSSDNKPSFLYGLMAMGLQVGYGNDPNYNLQIAGRNDKLAFRTKEAGIIGNWLEVYHTNNSNSTSHNWASNVLTTNQIKVGNQTVTESNVIAWNLITSLFELVDGKIHIVGDKDFYTGGAISSRGLDDTEGSGSGSFDLGQLWNALDGNTNEQINKSHLTNALSGYATEQWVLNILEGYVTDAEYLDLETSIVTLQSYFTSGKANNALDSEKLGGQLPSYYATKTNVDSLEDRVEVFESMFELVDGKIHIVGDKDFYTGGAISSRGLDNTEGSGSGSFDLGQLWNALEGNTNEQINKSHLTEALDGYATEQWVTDKNYLIESDIDETIVNVTLEDSTGIFTFTKSGGTTFTINSALEKVVTNFRYDSASKSLILTLADGTTQSVLIAEFIDNYSGNNTSTVNLTVNADTNVISANVNNSSITKSHLVSSLQSEITNATNNISSLQSYFTDNKANNAIDTDRVNFAYTIIATDKTIAEVKTEIKSILQNNLYKTFYINIQAGNEVVWNWANNSYVVGDGSVVTSWNVLCNYIKYAAIDISIYEDRHNYTVVLVNDVWGTMRKFATLDDKVADSYKLGGIDAANYYHSGNANKNTIDWTTATLTASRVLLPYLPSTWISSTKSVSQILGQRNQSEASAHSLFTVETFNRHRVTFGGIGDKVGFWGFTKANIDGDVNTQSFSTFWHPLTGLIEHSNDLQLDGLLKVGGSSGQTVTEDKILLWDKVASWFAEDSEGNIYVRNTKGFYTNSFLSAKGLDNSSTGGGSGIGLDVVWDALDNSTNEQINISHLTDALTDYATKSWIVDEGYVLTTDPRLTDSREASDVYDWAKSENKPVYSWGEITNKPTSFEPILNNIDWNSLSKTGFNWSSDNKPSFLYGLMAMGLQVGYGNDPNYNLQIAGRDDKLAFRTKEAGIIGNWLELFHTGRYPSWSEVDNKPDYFTANSIYYIATVGAVGNTVLEVKNALRDVILENNAKRNFIIHIVSVGQDLINNFTTDSKVLVAGNSYTTVIVTNALSSGGKAYAMLNVSSYTDRYNYQIVLSNDVWGIPRRYATLDDTVYNAERLGGQLPSYYATKTSVDSLEDRVEVFESMFELVDGKIHIVGDKDFYTGGAISSRGLDNTEGSGSGSFDLGQLWNALDGNTNEQINKSHLTDALDGYATEQWVTDKNYLTETSLNEINSDLEVLKNYFTSGKANNALDSDKFGGLLPRQYNPSVLYNTVSNNQGEKWIKIKINSTASWMLQFTINLYQSYISHSFKISGYNYSTTKTWYQPKVQTIVGDVSSIVKFGKDGDNELWVAIPAMSYTGVQITDVNNGFNTVDTKSLFTISIIDTIDESNVISTQQTSIIYNNQNSNSISHNWASNVLTTNQINIETQTITKSKVDKWDLISSLFELVDGKIHIVGDKDFYTGGAISSRGLDDTEGSGSGSFDLGQLWSALDGNTNEQINISHLTDALSDYAKLTDLSNNYLPLSGGSLTGKLLIGSDYGNYMDRSTVVNNAVFGLHIDGSLYSYIRFSPTDIKFRPVSDDNEYLIYHQGNKSLIQSMKVNSSVFSDYLKSHDDRDVLPNTTEINDLNGVKAFFRTKIKGSGTYSDLLVLDTYQDTSGGKINALQFSKSTYEIYHFVANQDDTSWGDGRKLAYITDTVSDSEKLGGIDSSAFAYKRYLGTHADYVDSVILLIPFDTIGSARITGKLYSEYAGSTRYQGADIDLWYSRWSTENSYNLNVCLDTYGSGAAWQLITCTHQDTTWLALTHTNTQQTFMFFEGSVGGTITVPFTKIDYYNSQTETALNVEINNSIVNRVGWISRKKFAGVADYAVITDTVANAEKLGGQLPSYYATKTSVDSLEDRVEVFESMFELVDGKIHIVGDKDFYTGGAISSRGLDDTEGSGSGSFDLGQLWSALDGNTNEQINISHLTEALDGYATEQWVTDKNYIQDTDYRLTNARPASDVYVWAKNSVKPTYEWSEIQEKPEYFPANALNIFTITGAGKTVLAVKNELKAIIVANTYKTIYVNISSGDQLVDNWTNDSKILPAGSGFVSYRIENNVGHYASVHISIYADRRNYTVVLSNNVWGTMRKIATLDDTVYGSNRLGGQLPSYYATSTSVSTLASYFINGVAKEANATKYLKYISGSGSGSSTVYDANLLNGGQYSNYGANSYWKNAPIGMTYGGITSLSNNYSYGGKTGILSIQLAHDVRHNVTNATKDLWFRSQNNLGWQNDWKQIWHSGNSNSTSHNWVSNVLTTNQINIETQTITKSKIDKWDLISSLFELVDGKIHVVGDKDFYTGGAISSRGLDDTEGSGSGSFDLGQLWSALDGNTNEQINKSHLTDALDGYATEQWVTDKNYLIESDIDETIVNVSLNSATGIFTFTKSGGTTFTINSALEKVVTNFRYDSASKSLILTLTDGTTQSVSMTAFIDNYFGNNTSTVNLTVNADTNVISANVNNSSITKSHLVSSLQSEITNATNNISSLQLSLISTNSNVSALQSYFTSGKANNALNSDKLGGQLPSYYATKLYVDTEFSKKLSLTGGTMTGAIKFQGFTNIDTPIPGFRILNYNVTGDYKVIAAFHPYQSGHVGFQLANDGNGGSRFWLRTVNGNTAKWGDWLTIYNSGNSNRLENDWSANTLNTKNIINNASDSSGIFTQKQLEIHSTVGGWARGVLQQVSNSGLLKFFIGTYGTNDDTIHYSYLGSTSAYNSVNNFKIYSDGSIGVQQTGYAGSEGNITKTKIDKWDLISSLFELVDGKIHIVGDKDFYTGGAISSRGLDNTEGSGSGSFDLGQLWSALDGNTNEQINISHLTNALSDYAKLTDLSNNYLPLSGGSLTGKLLIGSDYGNYMDKSTVVNTALYGLHINGSLYSYIRLSTSDAKIKLQGDSNEYPIYHAGNKSLIQAIKVNSAILSDEVLVSNTFNPTDLVVDTQRVKFYDSYNVSGTPSTYGNVMEINGIASHWKPQLWFDGGATPSSRVRYRNKSYSTTSWGEWKTLAFTTDTAPDSLKLGGQLSSYYAKASDLSAANTNISKLQGYFSGTKAIHSLTTDSLELNNIENKTDARLQFLQNLNNTTINPDSGWWSVLRTQHGGYANGYWQEMAYSFNSDSIKFRRNVAGTKYNWRTIAFTDSTVENANKLNNQSASYYATASGLASSNSAISTLQSYFTGGSANSAIKLSTARTIDITGAVEATAITFDGTANKNLEITNVKEAYLTWGGRNRTGTYSPLDEAINPYLGHNRFSHLPYNAVTVEYSTDGTNWLPYYSNAELETTSAQENIVGLFSDRKSFTIGKATTASPALATAKLRVTVDTKLANIYTNLNKLMLYVSTNGSNGSTCQVQKALGESNTFVNHTDKIAISGWSGWNTIDLVSLTTYGNTASSQYGKLRFIFEHASRTGIYAGLTVYSIFGYGGVGWTTPSTMAEKGTPYSVSSGKHTHFFGNVGTQKAYTTGGGTVLQLIANTYNTSSRGGVELTASTFARISGSAAISIGTSSLPFTEYYASGWYRTTGDGGIVFGKYGGGLHMSDSSFVTIYGGKRFRVINDTYNSLTTTGGYHTSNREYGLVGTYDSTKVQAIWNMGSAYKASSDGSSLGNLYGAAYAYSGTTAGANKAGSHQFLWCNNGVVRVALGDNIWTSGNGIFNGQLTVQGGSVTKGKIDKWDKICALFDTDDSGNVYVTGNKGFYSNNFVSARGVDSTSSTIQELQDRILELEQEIEFIKANVGL